MKPMNKHKQGGKMSVSAFTLIEVAIATALLIMALALFLGTFVSAKRSAVMSDNRMEAIENARSNMENLVSLAYLSPPLSPGMHAATGTVSTVPTNISYSVAIVTQTPSIVVKNIYLTNRWINPGSRITSTVSLAGSVSSELHP
ncbi:MAG: type II secretion system protein [Kiritimatiellaeota bacterium]|nr:type II secretion system protein [Kiritimatiellota bacterium]